MTDDETQSQPREGSIEGYDRDVEYVEAEPWVDEVIDAPRKPYRPRESRATDDRFRSGILQGAFIHQDAPAFRNFNLRYELPSAAASAAEQLSAASESRNLTVDAPTQTRPGMRFPIHVQLTVEARGAISPITKVFHIPEAGRVVTIDVTASDQLTPLTSTSATVRVLRGEDSEVARFELEATREGKAVVDVRAFADQQFVGAAHVDLMVQGDAQPGQQRVHVPATMTAAYPGELTLEIRLDAKREYYEFQLRGDGFTDLPVRAQFVDLDMATRGLQQQLNELARTKKYSSTAMQAILRGQGAGLFKRLPPAVRSKLVANVGVAQRLSIVLTENDPVPWELVYANGESGAGFLGDLYLVTRWQYGASPPLDVGRGARCYVLPPSEAPTSASAEIATVQQRIGNGAQLNRVDDVLAEIHRREFGLMHFAAHNTPNFARPGGSSIQLDQPFLQVMVGDDLEGTLRGCRPLVFVNACSSTTPTLTWAGAEGWATRFLVAGAGGFIGSLWEIRDGSAATFASEFYRHLAKDEPLGAAFREARTAIRQDGDPTWLAYTLYAHPYARYVGEPS